MLVDEPDDMWYCCVTNTTEGTEPTKGRDVVVTSLTEGHRIASSYFVEGTILNGDTNALKKDADGKDEPLTFGRDLIDKFGDFAKRSVWGNMNPATEPGNEDGA